MEFLIPLILMIHNGEEYLEYEYFHPDKRVFLFAQLLLTLIAAVAVHFMAAVILIALLLNGMQHCLASLWKRRILPGTATAACLLIPCSLYYLKSIPFGVAEWLIAPLFMMAAIRLSLYVGSKLLS